MSNTAGRINAGLAMSPRRRRLPARSKTATMAATTKVTTAARLTTDVVTFAAIVITILALTVGMIVAPFAVAIWYIPNGDNLRDQVREAEQIAPAVRLMLDRNCDTQGSGCLHKLGGAVAEVAPQ